MIYIGQKFTLEDPSGEEATNLWMMAPRTTRRAQLFGLDFADANLTNANDLELQEMSHEVCDFFASQVFGLKNMDAVPLQNGTSSNLHAINLAGHYNQRELVVCSDLAHKSIAQAGHLTKQTVRPLYCSAENNFRVPRQDLIDFIHTYGDRISCLVVTMGTTQLGTMNDLPFDAEIAGLIKRKGIWLHVDAAMGIQAHLTGSTDTTRLLLASADSVMTDPHKFVGVMDLSLLFVRTPHLQSIELPDQHYFPGSLTRFGTTRGGFPIAVAWKTIQNWGGLERIKAIAETRRRWTLRLSQGIEKAGFSLVTQPETTIVTVDMGKRDGQIIMDSPDLPSEVAAQLRSYHYQQILREMSRVDVGPLTLETADRMIHGLRIVITPKRQITSAVIDRTGTAFARMGQISKTASQYASRHGRDR